MTTLRDYPLGRRRRRAADRPRGGRARRVHGLPGAARRPARSRPALPRGCRAHARGAARAGRRDGPATMDGVIDWTLASQVARGVARLAARRRSRAVRGAGRPRRRERAARLRLHRARAVRAAPRRRGGRPRRVGRRQPRLHARRARPGGGPPRATASGRWPGSSAPPAARCWPPRRARSPASSPAACSASTSSPCWTPRRPARLLFVAPNLGHAAAALEADPDQLLRWVALHETTHALQFGGVPWLREHIAGTVRELLEGASLDTQRPAAIPDLDDLRGLARHRARGRRRALALGPERRELLDRMQAFMAVLEGYAEHVMDAVGEDVLDDLGSLRGALNRRRRERSGLPARARAPDRDGPQAAPVRAGQALLRRRRRPRRASRRSTASGRPRHAMPTLAELDAPGTWIERTGPPKLGRAAVSDLAHTLAV